MPPRAVQALCLNPWAFGVEDLDAFDTFYREHGFALLSGVLGDEEVAALESECLSAQERLVAGLLDERYGTTRLIEGGAGEKAARFANYVTHITELSPVARRILHDDRLVGLVERWLPDMLVSRKRPLRFCLPGCPARA